MRNRQLNQHTQWKTFEELKRNRKHQKVSGKIHRKSRNLQPHQPQRIRTKNRQRNSQQTSHRSHRRQPHTQKSTRHRRQPLRVQSLWRYDQRTQQKNSQNPKRIRSARSHLLSQRVRRIHQEITVNNEHQNLHARKQPRRGEEKKAHQRQKNSRRQDHLQRQLQKTDARGLHQLLPKPNWRENPLAKKDIRK